MIVYLSESHRIGWTALLGPPVASVAIVGVALWQQAVGNRVAAGPILTVALDLMPLIAGLGAAAIVADPAVELHLSLPTSFRLTVARRLLLVTAWPALLAAGFEVTLWLTNRRVWTPPVPLDHLIWLAPLVALTGIGILASAALRSVAAASGLVAVLWLAQELLAPSIVNIPWLQPVWLFYRYSSQSQADWLANRTVLLVAGSILVTVAFWLLGKSESLIASGGDQ